MSTDEISQELLEIAKSLLSSSQHETTEDHETDMLIDDEGEREDVGEDDDFDDYGIQSQDSFAPWIKSSIHQSYSSQTHAQKVSRPKQGSNMSSQGSVGGGGGSVRSSQSMLLSLMQLEPHDIIVEKMHIHYGLKGENPVSRLRFFPKQEHQPFPWPSSNNGDEREGREKEKENEKEKEIIACAMKESSYETLLPRVFEECAIRVFCRDKAKNSLVAEAYKVWCREYNSSTPFPTMSQ
jgi:hypothetical protein